MSRRSWLVFLGEATKARRVLWTICPGARLRGNAGPAARAQQKGPFLRTGRQEEAQFLYLFAAAAFVPAPAVAGSAAGAIKSTHSRIAHCAASPWRWPSFTMRV